MTNTISELRSNDGEPPTPALVRIVVYGPSGAGKTTTAEALGENLGRPLRTPGVDELGRTTYFDWMEFEGGSFGGAPIRTQLVTAPGHDPARRVALLGDADVILFVIDTTESGLTESIQLLAEVRREVAALATEPALVFQANKRDAPDARPIDEVRSRLAIDPETPMIETVAPVGDGVRIAFVKALRGGVERLERGAEAGHPLDLDELLARLDALSGEDEPMPPPPRPGDAIRTEPPLPSDRSALRGGLRRLFRNP
ncbi:MAG: GTPase domain-containing protein [Actinomycetota bacterium]